AGTEVGSGDAAAPALATVVAGQAAVHRFCKNRETCRNAGDIEVVAGFLDDQFGAARLWWRQGKPVWRAGDIFFRAEDADVALDFVVVRREVVIADGPVGTETIARVGTEVDRRKTQCDAAPMIRASADDT